jgi:hypothetical protein
MQKMSNAVRMIAVLALASGIIVTTATIRPADAQSFGLEGSWAMTVTALEPPGLPPLSSLVTFIRGGDVIESRRGYLPFTPFGPVLETAGHGGWRRVGLREFASSFLFLVQAAPNNQLFTLGEPLGTDAVRLQITLTHANRFTGTFVSEARDQAGMLVFTASGTVDGTRLE